MKPITRNQLLSGAFSTAIVLLMSYLVVKASIALWSGMTLEGWKFIGLVALGFALIKIGALSIVGLYRRYVLKRLSKNGLAILEALNAISLVLIISIASAMAMRAYYLDRLDNILMWGGLVLILVYRLIKDLKTAYLEV